MGRLAVFGHVNVDTIVHVAAVPKPDHTVEVTGRETRWGGTAGNIAAVAASLGADVALGGYVGHDFPAAYREHLERLGIDLRGLVQKSEHHTPTWWGFIGPEGHVIGFVEQGPMKRMAEYEPLLGPLEGAQVAHFSTGDPKAWLPVARAARKQNKTVAFDPGQELSQRYTAQTLEAMLEEAHVAFFNRVEMEHALSLLRYGTPEQLFDHDLDLVIETRSGDGAIVHTPQGSTTVPAVRVEKVVDPTGAGDAFRAGFHAAHLAGKDPLAAVREGAAAAAVVIGAVGGQGRLPTRRDIGSLLAIQRV